MVMDGQGGAIVVFEQKNSATYDWELWAQRIDANGNIQWNFGGIPVTNVISEHLNERIQSDGQGGVYIAFQDFRNGMDYDVYVQHLGPNGEYLWGTGILACNAPGSQTNPKIDPDPNGGLIVAWTDKRNMIDYDIYAQRIDFNGNILWGNEGKTVCSVPGNQSAIDLLSNSVVDGVILTWKDERTGVDYDIYCNRLDWNGNQTWTMNGMPVCVNSGDQINPNITGDGYGGAAIVWQDQTTGNFDIRMQRLYAEGYIQYPLSGYIVSNAIADQTSPKSASTDLGEGVFAWEDNRTGLADIYCSKVLWGGPWVNVEEVNEHLVQLYPNPTSDLVYLSLNSDVRVHLSVFAMNGKKMVSEVFNQSKIEMHVADWPAGLYCIQLQTNNKIEHLQFVKQ
jgi:predicted lipoprotein with Yx(FWY)xxD motif